MLHEIVRQLVQPVVGGDDFVILPQQLLQQRLLVRVEFGFLDGVGDAVVEIQPGDAKLLAAILINQLHRGLVFFGPFEIVARNVTAEDAPGQMVVFEQRRAGKSNERRIGQRQPHVARKLARLRAVRLVRNHDDVVPLAVRLARVHVLIEFVNQAENVAMILASATASRSSPELARGVFSSATPHPTKVR